MSPTAIMFARALLSFVCLSAVLSTYATTFTDDPAIVADKTFDFVVAGGGLTAIVVGNKLSAKGYSVLLIEAGKNLPDHAPIYNIERRSELNNDPATDCNWHYAASWENGTDMGATVDSGKCVGGSTSINGAMWFRPGTVELDALKLFGNNGWDSASLLPYFVAEETNTPPTADQKAQGMNYNPAYHGFSGPVNTSFPTPLRIPSAQALYKEAISEAYGLSVNDDLSDRQGAALASSSWSIWYDPVTKINYRSSAAYAYLYPASQQRDTLTVLHGHTVGKVLFDSKVAATGLQFGATGGGKLYTVKAKKEVLLAAGSLASPPILERSGIGGKSILKKFGIQTLVDLPAVGLNLQDQPGTGLSALATDAAASNTSLIDGRNIFAPVIGLASIDNVFGTRSSSWINSLRHASNLKARVKSALSAGAFVNEASGLAILAVAIDLITRSKTAIAELVGESYPAVFTHVFWPSTPLSRGHIHIQSADPFAAPRITPRFLTDDFDMDIALTIAKKGRALFQSSYFSPLVANPAADGPSLNATDSEWKEWLVSSSFGASHWTGSCAMLPKAIGGVVSDKLKVYGTKRLRVVDASILPLQITSHTQSTAYAIAQKAADLIIADYA